MYPGRDLLIAGELADELGITEHVVGKTVWVSFKVPATNPATNPATKMSVTPEPHLEGGG